MITDIIENMPPAYVSFIEIDSEGFIVNEHIFVEGEEPADIPSNWIRELVPDFDKPKWDGVKWIEAGEKKPLFTPIQQEPSEIDVLKQEIQILKQEIESLKE